jgi:O-antigen ligase
MGLLALIFLTGSFIPANIIDLRLPIGGGLDLRDLTLLGLFGVVLLRELGRGTLTIPWWPVGGPLFLFLIMTLFSAFYALFLEHVESNWVLGELRILILYSAFFVTLWCLKRPEQLKVIIIGLFLIADLTTGIIYLQQVLGADTPLLQAMMMNQDWRVYEQAGVLRIVPAGQVLMHFMWFVALGVLVLARPNWLWRAFCIIQLGFIGGGHLLTYMRAQWLALILGFGLFCMILLLRYKKLPAKAAVVIYCAALLLAAAVVIVSGPLSEASDTPFAAGITERFSSILTPSETAESDSLQWREFEIEKALQSIQRQPLTGVGLGNRYRELTAYQSEASGLWTWNSVATGVVSRFTRYVHNSYLALAVKMGIPGLLAFLWFCAAVLLKGAQVYRDLPDSEYKGMVLGILVGFASLFVWVYFHAHLIKAESTATIGLMAALIGSIAYIHGSASHPSGDHSRPVNG